MASLEIRDLTFSYPAGDKNAINGLDLTLESGSFNLLCGGMGSGKTTLLRLIKREIAPYGKKAGTIKLDGREISGLSDCEAASEIGFVFQRGSQQPVTERVWQELAFGAENLGLPAGVIRRRVAETASFYGIGNWFDKKISELSGGQLQLLNLAAVTVMQPSLLLLDEPTSALDPLSAEDFLSALERLNREIGVTVLLSEHRLEETAPKADRVICLEKGRILLDGTAENVFRALPEDSSVFEALPSSVKVFRGLNGTGRCPVTVGEGKSFLESLGPMNFQKKKETPEPASSDVALNCQELFFSYPNGTEALRGVDLEVFQGEAFFLLGANGSGKSTLLRLISGLERSDSGKILLFGRKIERIPKEELFGKTVALLPQDVTSLFTQNRVCDEIEGEVPSELHPLAERHPYDLSGGEQQQLALEKVLQKGPKLLLLDEPTLGLDGKSRKKLTARIRELVKSGLTVLCVTHDTDFAAETADRCGLLFRGQLVAADPVRPFFDGNCFFTTPSNRMAGRLLPGVLTPEEIVSRWRKAELHEKK